MSHKIDPFTVRAWSDKHKRATEFTASLATEIDDLGNHHEFYVLKSADEEMRYSPSQTVEELQALLSKEITHQQERATHV
jgi:hypothetical protein